MELKNNIRELPKCERCQKNKAFVWYIDMWMCGDCVAKCNEIIMESKKKETKKLKEILGIKE